MTAKEVYYTLKRNKERLEKCEECEKGYGPESKPDLRALSSLVITIGSSGVGLNIELSGFCAFLPYLFGAPQTAGGKPAKPTKTPPDPKHV